VSIGLVIGEDHYLVREGVRRLLESTAEVTILASCGDLPSLEAAVREHQPDVVLTDIRMPPTHMDEGIRLSEWLRRARPQTGVVVLSQYAEADYALALFDKGAARRAYLLKERVFELHQLVDAIRQVSRGGSVIDPKVVERLVEARSRATEPLLDSLTPRERQVLAEVAQGKNNAAIAASLFLTERAVEKHINSIFSKLAHRGAGRPPPREGRPGLPLRRAAERGALNVATHPGSPRGARCAGGVESTYC